MRNGDYEYYEDDAMGWSAFVAGAFIGVLEMWVIGLLCAFLSRRNEVQSADRLDARTLGLISRGLSVPIRSGRLGGTRRRDSMSVRSDSMSELYL